MTSNAKIPQINVTLEPNENNSLVNNIGETLTDVEDLEEGAPIKNKSKLRIKLVEDGAITDLEDLETSDNEDDHIIKSVSFSDLHLDTYNTEETVLTDNHDKIEGNLQKFSQNYKELDVPKLSPIDEGLTDAENFVTDDENESEEFPEADINFDDYYADFVKVSSDLKSPQASSMLPSTLTFPEVESNELTDLESLSSDNDEKKCLIKKTKAKRKKGKGCYRPRHESDGEDEKKWKRCARMKKSLSQPLPLNHQQNYTLFESDGEAEEKCFLKFPLCKKVTKKPNYDLTDTEELEEVPRFERKCIGVKEKQKFISNAIDVSSSSGTDEEILEGDTGDVDFIDLALPPPVRTLILLHEDKSLIPTAKILPLKELNSLGITFRIEEGGTTDVEFFNDDNFLDVESVARGPTPEIPGFEDSTTVYGESRLTATAQRGLEPLTDTEDIDLVDNSKMSKKLKNKTLQLIASAEAPTTDTEDFYWSDSNRSPLKRRTDIEDFATDDEELSVGNSKFYVGGIASSVTARDAEGSSTTKNHLNITHRVRDLATSPNLTDVEDLVASADEEVIVRSRTATPNEFLKHLEQQRSSKVHIESTKKIDLDNPNEIMYLKGGCYVQNHTDVEDMSDDNMREWDVAKKSAPQEEAPLAQDAEQQDTPSHYVTYESVLLQHDTSSIPSPSSPASYKQIDDMLEKMLSEVEQQEKLFNLDLDVLEPDDSYVNTLELVPETDALIEIPMKKSGVYATYREIQILEADEHDHDDDEHDDERLSNCLVNHAQVASSESLTDEDSEQEEQFDYEPVEYNALTHIYQRFDTYPENDIWFEGTYRNLSIVPEEDEDESTSLLSNYSNSRKRSFSSNQYSFCDSFATKDHDTDSSDSGSTDDSDIDDQVGKNESIVKAEVKLLVKTSEQGKEAIEIRSVREFLENPPETSKPSEAKKKSSMGDKLSSLKNKFSSIVDRSKRNLNFKQSENESREELLKEEKKPSFTFQQLFVRTPEALPDNLQESKRFGSRNELVASSSERFPLVYDPETSSKDDEVLKEIKNVDLFANIPFYPCYKNDDHYGFKAVPSPHINPFTETISNPFGESDDIPRAYCDWLEDLGGGISTTTERLVASNEETLLDKPLGQQLTGLSVIDDNLVIDLKTVFDQTNAFIQSESQPEPYDALAEKYTRKEPINDKKVDDTKNNMNEKKKAKKGFFGSIKTFVERSFESDSESEKSPKKVKKPKKDKKKKSKEDKPSEQSLPPKKPKLPTPPLAPSDLDSIPFVEASISDLPPPYKPPDVPTAPEPILVTDLDADLETKPPPQKVKEMVKEKTPPKKKLASKTVTVEEVTKKIEPLFIESEEFSIIVDPTKKESPKKSKETFTISIDESVDKKEQEILEKSPILSEEKIVKPLVALDDVPPVRPPRVKEHVYEDIEETPVNIKNVTTDLIQNEINFGGWADDKHDVTVQQTTKISDKTEKVEEHQKEIVEKQDKEVSKEKDVKAEDDGKKKEEKKTGFFGLFKKRDSKKEEEEVSMEKKPPLSEAVRQDMEESTKFLVDEVQNYHDVRPVEGTVTETVTTTTTEAAPAKPESEEAKTQSDGFFGLFKKPKKDEKTPEKKAKEKEEKATPEKKAKKEKPEPTTEKKVAVVLSEEVHKNMFDSKQFLESEVQNYQDVRPEKATPVTEEGKVEEAKELSPKKVIEEKEDTTPKKTDDKREDSKESSPKPGFFGLFKKSKKEQEIAETKVSLSEEVVKDMKETEQFLVVEVENYHDVKPVEDQIAEDKAEIVKATSEPSKKTPKVKKELSREKSIERKEATPKKTVEDARESSPKPGFFGLFKKAKKDEPETPETKVALSEEVQKDIKDSDQFLVAEVENYHDVKPTQEEIIQEEAEIVKATPESSKKSPKVKKGTSTEKADDKKESAPKKTVEDARESSPKPGIFGIFKKSKKDEPDAPPIKVLSEEVQKDMKETDQFLIAEVENYHDVKPIKEEVIQEVAELVKTTPELSKKSPKVKKGTSTEKADDKKELTPKKTVEDARESSPKPGIFSIFKKSKKDEPELPETKIIISEEVQRDMKETDQFLVAEVENYHDVKPLKEEVIQEVVEVAKSTPELSKKSPKVKKEPFTEKADEKEELTPKKTLEDARESSPKPGIFSIFKKSKKDELDAPQTKAVLSEEVQRDMKETDQFLIAEVENYNDVKPTQEEIIQEVAEVAKATPEPSKKSPKVKKGTSTEKESTPKKTLEDARESSPKPGIFSIFKKSKKDEPEVTETKITISEEVQKDMKEPDQFLVVEVENYQDVKPGEKVTEEVAEVVKTTLEASEKSPKVKKEPSIEKADEKKESSSGFFGLFKKSKKDEPEKPVLSEEAVKCMKETDQFLVGEIENYHDVKPIKEVTQEVVEATKAMPEPPKKDPKMKKEPSTDKADEKKEQTPKKTVEDSRESSPKPGFFGIFKKSKKDEPEAPEIKVVLSDEVQKDMKETDQFLVVEVENYHDVKPSKEEIVKEETKVAKATPELSKKSPKVKKESSVEKTEEKKTIEDSRESSAKPGFFGIFKKSKKDEPETSETKMELSEDVKKDMHETGQFLAGEVQNYHDVKPITEEKKPVDEVKEVVETIAATTESQVGGFLGLFKKSKKDEEGKVEKPQPSDTVKDIADSKQFLTDEAQVKSEKEASVEKEQVTESAEQASSGFFGLFKKTKKDDEKTAPEVVITKEVLVVKDEKDPEQIIEEEKVKKVEEARESSPKPSGFFGLFKKSKKDEEEAVSGKPVLSDSVLKDMNDTSQFLTTEVEHYHDVKPEKFEPIEEEKVVKAVEDTTETASKSKGLFGIFKKSKKEGEQPETKSTLVEEVQKDISDTKSFLKDEVQNYHDAKLEITDEEEKVTKVVEEVSEAPPKPARGLFGIFKKSKKSEDETVESRPFLSESVEKDMEDSKQFLVGEIDNYHDVKPEKFPSIEEHHIVRTAEPVEASTKSSRGLFGIFKKSKKEEEEATLSEDVQKDTAKTSELLEGEVEKYQDVKPSVEEKVTKVVEEVKEAPSKTTVGLFSLFKKPKKDEEGVPVLSEAVLKNMDDTKQFLLGEVENYHDVKPIIKEEEKIVPKVEEKVAEQVPAKTEIEDLQQKTEPKVGFLSKFKKTKKKPETQLSEEAQKSMDETKNFLSTEQQHYQDAKTEAEKKDEKTVTFDTTKTQMVLEGHLPQPEVAHVVEVVRKEAEIVREIKEETKEVVKETLDEPSKVIESVDQQDGKLSKKDKQSKDKKGFFNIFGKKSKSHESSFEESRGRPEEEPEGSPKKHKRRKSSSPFKFFDKMRKSSDEDLKEHDDEVSTVHKMEDTLQETGESKEDLLTVEFEDQPSNLSEEVLGSLDKKMEELRSKYTPETRKIMNDCRDFLFIEVDNYEDAKPVVVTDIDDAVTTGKVVDDIIQKATKVVEDTREKVADQTKKTGETLKTGVEETKAAATEAAEATAKAASDVKESAKKSAKKAEKKAGGFFSKLGGLISGSVEDTKNELKEAKKSAEKAVDKTKESAQKSVDSAVKNVEAKIEETKTAAEKSVEAAKKAKDEAVEATEKKISETKKGLEKAAQDASKAADAKIDETKEKAKDLKDSATEAVVQKVDDLKRESTAVTAKVAHTAVEKIDEAKEVTQRTVDQSKENAQETTKTLIDAGQKQVDDIKGDLEKIKEQVVHKLDKTKESVTDAAAETIEDARRTRDDAVDEVTKKVVDTKTDAQKRTQQAIATAEEKIDQTKVSSAKVVEAVTQKTDEIKKDAESTVATAKEEVEKAAQESVDKLSKTKDSVKETTTKKIGDLEKVKESTIQQTSQKIESVADSVTQAKDSAIGGIFKLKETVTASAIQKIDEVEKTKKTVQEQVAAKTDDISKVASQKVEDLSKVKESAAQRLDDLSKTATETQAKMADDFAKTKEDFKESAAEKVDALAKAKENIEKSAVQKVDDISKAAAGKIEELAQAKDSIEKSATQKVADVSKSATAKIDELTKTAESVKDSAAQRVDDISKATATKIDELSKAKETIKDSAGKKAQEVSKEASTKVDEIIKAKEDVAKSATKEVDDISKAAKAKVDELSKAKESVKQSATKKAEEVSKAAAEKIDELARARESVEKSAAQNIDDISKVAKSKVDELSKAKESVKESAAKTAEEVSKAASIKVDELTKAKESVEHSAARKIDDISKATSTVINNVAQTKESVEESAAKKAEEVTKSAVDKMDELFKAKESVEESAAQKVDAISKAATAKIDELSKAKESVKESATKKAEEISKVASDKITELTKVKESVVKSAEQKVDDISTKAAAQIDDLVKTRESVKESAIKKAEEVSKTATEKIDDLTRAKQSVEKTAAQKVDDISKTATAKIDDLARAKQSVTDSAAKKADEISKAATEKIDALAKSVDTVEKSAAEKADIISKAATGKIDEITKSAESIKESAAQEVDDVSKTTSQKLEDLGKVKDSAISAFTEAKDTAGDKLEEAKKEASQKVAQKIDSFTTAKESVKDITAQQIETLSATTSQKKDEITKAKESVKDTAQKMIHDIGETKESIKTEIVGEVSKTKGKVEDAAGRRMEELVKVKQKATDEFEKVKEETKESVTTVKEDLQKTAKSTTEKATKTIDGIGSKVAKETSGLFSKLGGAISGTKDEKKEDVSSKMAEIDDELAKLTSSLEQLSEPKPCSREVEKVKSYVTSPTMARRAESQRFPRGERPMVREITNLHDDEDSDEGQYTVTEPEETEKRRPLFHLESEDDDSIEGMLKGKERRDSVKSNVLETLSEDRMDNLLNTLESQLVKDLEESVAGGKEKVERTVTKAEIELETIEKDSQADVEQIEQKLRDLDKALDSLEQASDPKLEKKLHRVERKFERMASEVMEKETVDTSPTEVEVRREHEFQRLVSQLSTEEVSDFQKEYSHLWDETTFSKSDEWDSKTPDSQVDVQDLPQGEVVYMGPVTLNRDNLVNKAGVEVDVIPIMRSPCHTPKPTKKNLRAKSAMDFYEETSSSREFDRGSLPDLKRSSLKGSTLVSTIVELNPDRFLYGSTTSLRSNASSGSELSRGEIMNAVLDWLEKSNTNESSVDSASVASSDSNLSQLSGKTKPVNLPTIRITDGNSKKRSKRKGKVTNEGRETTCAPTLTEETKSIPQPKPRFAKETPLQFSKDSRQKLEKQISPVRDDLLDDEDSAVPETYSDKKKFWENVTKESTATKETTSTKRMSLHEISAPKDKDVLKKRVSVHEVSTVPVPKPRSAVHSQSIDESARAAEEQAEETKIMSEYQASFQPPSERKSKSPPKVESDKESTDSESENLPHSGANENAGYISDSGDVEHYISDSEIEDRVPQIRERQMSVFAPPVAAVRKTIYERSASLPTEDLYEVSARSIKLRKQYYEEQIKKEMIEEQLTSEIEEEPSPERKTLLSSLVQQLSEEKAEKIAILDIARSFDETKTRSDEIHDIKDFMEITEKKEVSFEDERQSHKPDGTHTEDQAPISSQTYETHKEIDLETQTKRSSLGSEQDSSSEVDRVTKPDSSTSKPDSMEVHVDKSEIEDSEKLAELDQDATDLETKSLDSLNAVEMSPKSSHSVEETIPEITVTLSGKQRRISEESDEYAPKTEKKVPELDSPINVPEEHVEDTVWEVSVQSQEARFDEKVTSFDSATLEKIERDEDLSLSTRDESDLGSEIHQDHSDSYASDKIKSESHSDIERIILDSLHQQKVDPVEAKSIASALIEEIEAEIQRRESLPSTTTTPGEVTDYLKYLAETKGLDEREVELVESVLARRQRELAKLSRGDTQASSIEITDEDLKYSGTEVDTSHLLEQQISQLKAEKVDDIKSMTFLDKIDEKHIEETHSTKDYETYEDGFKTMHKSDLHTKTYESVKGERTENKDTIFEEDETVSESATHESEQVESKVEALATEVSHKKTDDSEMEELRRSSADVTKAKSTDITAKTSQIDAEDSFTTKTEDVILKTDTTKSSIKHEIDLSEKKIDEELKLRGEITCDDLLKKEESSKKGTSSEVKELKDGAKIQKDEAVEEIRSKVVRKELIDKEVEETRTTKDADSTIKQSQVSSKVTSVDVVRESSTSSEVMEKIETIDLDPSLLPSELGEIKTVIEKHEEIKRTSSSESKSSIESGKSPEDQFSTCSSGRKGDSDSSKAAQEVLMRKTTSLQKGERKSGVDFETYSSSGESHYHSFELDSGKSRPCSSDVEGLVAAGSSEYESALTSQDYSSRSHVTSTEYHTAVSSLSSKESMKSLDSESSGHLGSVEVSELSETLVPSASDLEGDILDAGDQLDDGAWSDDQPQDIIDEPSEKQSKMKRSYEMTFQPEPKMLSTSDSPQADELDRKFTSMDDGSILSMSLSSTSGTEPRTVIELSRADSERIEGGSMSVSGISDQLSIEGSCDSLVFHPGSLPNTTDTSTSTGHSDTNLQIESITITTSMVNESGIRSVSTQVTSESHTPEEDRAAKPEETAQINGKCQPEIKKKTHRRQESTSAFVPSVLSGFHSDLTESDKYTAELSFKEVISDEKKDIDEREKEESYETEADQGFHRDIREGKYHDPEEENKDDTPEFSSETQASVGELEQEYSSALARSQEIKKREQDLHIQKEPLEKRDSHGKSSSTSSEKSSFEEAEAEAAFNMVAHVSPAHKIKQICPILEDEDAEKHELETRERAQKEHEKRRAQIRDQSPGSIPDIRVTQHMTPLVDRNFHYPDLELEEQERQKDKEEKEKESTTEKSTPQTPSSKSSEETDQGREYVLEDSGISIPEEPTTESRSTVIEQTVKEDADKDTDSPNSDSFEMLEKPDLIDDFVVIEEVAKEAQEFDSEGKSVSIKQKGGRSRQKKHDEEVEAYLTKSAPTPLTKMTDVKFYPDGSSSEELGFDFEDSPPINNEASASSYDKELEANKKWIEQQFQGDQAARMAAGYDYEMEFERGPLEDIKEEDINDFDPNSSRIGSLGSQKESGGSLGSVKDSYSSTPEYDVLAGRKYFTRSGEHDDVSMSSLQEFENLERAMSLENKRHHQGSQDSSSNGSFKTRYYASKSGQGDDVSVSSLKEFEGLEMACIAAHKIEVKAKEEEAMLAQIDEGQESLASESESCETVSRTDKKVIPDSDEEDYEKRMFEIDEIIRQAQSNVERFIDLKEGDKTESLGRGDSIEEVSKVPDLDLDAPIVRSSVKVQWKESDNVMVTSTDSIDGKVEKPVTHHDSTDSLDQKTCADIMTASTDSIEFQARKNEPINLLSDSIEIKDEVCGGMITSDSLELGGKITDSESIVDPTSSTATHATYQYETDSVFSGSFTSGGSNTMVSSTDTIDPVQVDIAAAARKVWFDEDSGSSRRVTTEYQDTGKPYVTEVIEPSEDDGYSHTIHRRVELPPEVRKVSFYGSDADEKLRQFIEDFGEGEHVEEVEEVDAAGNVHTRRVVQRRFIVRGEEGPEMEEFLKKSVASKTNQLTSFPKETTGEEAGFAASGTSQDTPLKAQASRRRQLRYEISVDDQIEVDPREHDWRFNLPEHAEGEESVAGSTGRASEQRPIADQHQLSEEMKQLLKELERESKQ